MRVNTKTYRQPKDNETNEAAAERIAYNTKLFLSADRPRAD